MKSKVVKIAKDELISLREKFISKYSRMKGWNPSKLSTQQMLEITLQKEYQNPK